jgi:hypothetical protein
LEWPTDFRKFMGWIFALTCLEYLIAFVRSIPNAIQQHFALPLLWRLLYAPIFPAVFAAISGVAWWAIWKGKRSTRAWAIAASLMYILVFLRPFIIPLRPVYGHNAGALFIGIVGLLAFLWYGKPTHKNLIEWLSERGDFTTPD